MGPLLGLALDGVGLGGDDTSWGGELLYVDGAQFRRMGHLHPLALPGGDRAAREPWRMAAAVLHQLGRNDEIARRFPQQAGAATVAAMLQRGLNCPLSSSMGRLFDAAAGLLGVCEKMEYEAQAAIRLEQLAAEHGPVAPLARGYVITAQGVLDFRPLLMNLSGCDNAAYGAALFHSTLASGLGDWVAQAASKHGFDSVALGGGCFLNGVLNDALQPVLAARGLRALTSRQLPPGDSAISLGQAWVAQQHLAQGN
jgi:hydrogenase maturation protein HypF